MHQLNTDIRAWIETWNDNPTGQRPTPAGRQVEFPRPPDGGRAAP
jgi:hypothetical protein